MTETIHVIEGETETIVTELPPEYPGPPTNARVRIYTPSTALPDEDSWQAATAEATTASTNAAAAARDTTLSFASDPGLTAGRLYTIDIADGIDFRPRDTGTTVTLPSPLPMAVPSGTSIYSRTVTHALTADETDTRGPGFALFEADDANGVLRRWRVAFEVVPARLQVPLTLDELLAAWPKARDWIPAEDETAKESIQAAWDHEVLPELRARGIEEEFIFNAEPLRTPLLEAVRWRALRDVDDGTPPPRDDLERAYRRALASSDWWEAPDRDTDQPAPDEPARPIGTFTLRR